MVIVCWQQVIFAFCGPFFARFVRCVLVTHLWDALYKPEKLKSNLVECKQAQMADLSSSTLFETYIKPHIPSDHPILNPQKIASILKSQGTQIPLVSVLQIIIDLLDCVLSSRQKVQKRWNRLLVVLDILQIPTAPLAAAINISDRLANEETTTLPAKTIIKWLKKPRTVPQGTHILAGENDDSVKKVVEAALTSAFNDRPDLGPYNVATKLMKMIWYAVSTHPRLEKLVNARDILLIFKGGIAQRLMLTAVFPEHTKTIHKAFGLGGDNDCGILINPELPNYNTVRDLVISVVRKEMLIRSQFIQNNPVLLDAANDVVKISPADGITLGVFPSTRKHFAISRDEDKNAKVQYFPLESAFYSSENPLYFMDKCEPKPRTCAFMLIRAKWSCEISYECAQKTYFVPAAAELLDIAISDKDDGKLTAEHFHKYKDWSFMTMF